jgi:hypothetical protein
MDSMKEYKSNRFIFESGDLRGTALFRGLNMGKKFCKDDDEGESLMGEVRACG